MVTHRGLFANYSSIELILKYDKLDDSGGALRSRPAMAPSPTPLYTPFPWHYRTESSGMPREAMSRVCLSTAGATRRVDVGSSFDLFLVGVPVCAFVARRVELSTGFVG